jgi:hypothetical protein
MVLYSYVPSIYLGASQRYTLLSKDRKKNKPYMQRQEELILYHLAKTGRKINHICIDNIPYI